VPELPEVEVVRSGLDRHVVGRTIAAVEVSGPRTLRRHLAGGEDFAARLIGRRIESARRRGKYLWLPLDSGEALAAHLGMSGQFVVAPPGFVDPGHLRARLSFADLGPQLRFRDQRTFGGLAVVKDGYPVPPSIAHVARDPLDPEFDEPGCVAAIRRRNTGLKRALLDQTLVSGIGNIYADEALWRARLHYARPTSTLRRGEVVRVLAGVREVFTEALAAGGTSFDALYVNVEGERGHFERELAVYGRAGQPCPRCGRPVRRDPFMNRSSYFCPGCQPPPRRAPR